MRFPHDDSPNTTVFLKKFDITVKFVTNPAPEAFAAAIDAKTKAIYVESIGNPKNTVALLPEIAKVYVSSRTSILD